MQLTLANNQFSFRTKIHFSFHTQTSILVQLCVHLMQVINQVVNANKLTDTMNFVIEKCAIVSFLWPTSFNCKT